MPVNNTSSVSTYSYLQYKNKISGLASGMDIDSIMEKLMKAESAQMEKLQQQKQKYEWKRDAYRSVNTSITTFQQKLLDSYGLKSAWTSKTANVTNSSYVSAIAGANASGTLSIDSISQLAKAATTDAKNVSQAQLQRASEDMSLADLKANLASQGIDVSDLTSNGKLEFTVTSKNKEQEEFTYNYSIDYNDSMSLKDLGKAISDAKPITVTKTVDGVTTEYTGNDAPEVSVVGSYNATTGKFSVSAKGGTLTATDDTKNKLSVLGIGDSGTPNLGGKITLNGKTATTGTTLADLGITGPLNLNVKVGDTTKTIVIDSTVDGNPTTIKDVLDKITNETGLKASMSNGQISLTPKAAGAQFSLTGDNLDKLGLDEKSSLNSSKTLLVSTGPYTPTGSTLLGELGIKDGSLILSSLQENGKVSTNAIAFKADDTIDSFVSRLNSSNAGVTALFSNGQLVIKGNSTGKSDDGSPSIAVLDGYNDGKETYNDASGLELLGKLGFGTEVDPSNKKPNSEGLNSYTLADNGQKSEYTVNGLKMSSNSNTVDVSGYTLTLKDTFNISNNGSIEKPADNVVVTSTSNVDDTVTKVKEFINEYNELVKGLKDKTTEKRQITFEPLTDAQKSQMTEKEIELWEEKAKDGLLRSDSNIESLLSNMRSIIYGTSNGGDGAKGLFNLGITTSKSYKDGGTLELDERKLRAELEKDPDIIAKVFAGNGEAEGIVAKLRTVAKNTVTQIEKQSGKASSVDNSHTLGKSLISINEKIDDWKDRLKAIEERYWKQFSAMESAIQKANSQSSIFSQA